MLIKRPLASRVAGGALKLLIRSMCTVADDLEVDIDANTNLDVLSGQLNAVSVSASRICLNGVMVSAGAALYTDALVLQPGARTPKLAKPLAVSIRAAMTERDLNRDGPIRDACQMLLQQIISTGLTGALGRLVPSEIGGVECILENVELEDKGTMVKRRKGFWGVEEEASEGKLLLHARAKMRDGDIKFSVRTGLCTINDGNVVMLKDPELIWRKISVPMVTIGMIGVKLEDQTQLTSVEIVRGTLAGDGIIVFMPEEPPKRGLRSSGQGRQKRLGEQR